MSNNKKTKDRKQKRKFLKKNADKFELADERYIRFKNIELSYGEFCQLFDFADERVVFSGQDIKVSGLRLETFRKNSKCVQCGMDGTHFHLEYNSLKDGSPHLNLYGVDSRGDEVLFTKDHIYPKSKGGKDHIDNMQTMCSKCNQEKGNKIEGE